MSKIFKFNCAGKMLDLSQPRIMGVLNITPDSFYEGSRCSDNWLKVAEQMIHDGAHILDIGGESTRPGASKPPTPEEELDRVIPVIEGITSRFNVITSVDTSSALVMKEAIRSGVGMINDVRALKREGALEAAAETYIPIILMHSLTEPSDTEVTPIYSDIIETVSQYLADCISRCEKAGIHKNRLILDPGFGGGELCGKTPVQNLEMLKSFNRLHQLKRPLLAGMSRKSFIGATLDRDVDDRLPGSLAAALLATQSGAHIIRTHDVRETVDVLRFLQAVQEA